MDIIVVQCVRVRLVCCDKTSDAISKRIIDNIPTDMGRHDPSRRTDFTTWIDKKSRGG